MSEPTTREGLLAQAIDNIYQSMRSLINDGIIVEDGNASKFAKILMAKLYLIKAGIKD